MADAADDDDDDTPTEHGNERLSMPGTPDHVSEACELLDWVCSEGSNGWIVLDFAEDGQS